MNVKACTEAFLAESGLNYTVFRLCGFMQASERACVRVCLVVAPRGRRCAADSALALVRTHPSPSPPPSPTPPHPHAPPGHHRQLCCAHPRGDTSVGHHRHDAHRVHGLSGCSSPHHGLTAHRRRGGAHPRARGSPGARAFVCGVGWGAGGTPRARSAGRGAWYTSELVGAALPPPPGGGGAPPPPPTHTPTHPHTPTHTPPRPGPPRR